MPRPDDRILCESPTPGAKGTRIPRWKYDAVRAAIRKALASKHARADGVEFRELPTLVEHHLPAAARADLGSIMWHVTTVKLHMETAGEVERVPGSKPQRVRLVK